MLGKEIIPMREMIKKIEAAVDAKQEDPDFVLNIRTDAISAVGGEAGIEEAIKRGNAYAEAGATLIFVEAPPTIDGIKRVVREINAPVSINMLEGGKTPLMTVKELEEIGVARVSCPLTAIFASAKGIYDSLKTLREMGTTRDIKEEKLMDFREFNKLIGLPRIRELEKRFLTLEKIKAKFGKKEKLEKAKEEGV
jgi:methylisocitrate lyase